MKSFRLSIFVAFAALASVAWAQSVRYQILFQGSPIGETVATTDAKGVLTSKSSFKLGPMDLKSELELSLGKVGVKAFKIVETSGANSGSIAFANGKVDLKGNGVEVMKQQPMPWAEKPLFSPYHPDALLTILRAVMENPGAREVEFINPNTASTLKATVSARRVVATISGRPASVRMLMLSLGGLEVQAAFDDSGEKALGINIPAQMFQIVRDGFAGVFVDPLAKFPELSQAVHKSLVTDSKQMVPMRDGVKLAAEVLRPAAEGKFPTVLIRTPYGREMQALTGGFWAQRGYVVVVQDTRGRGDSEGRFDPFNTEVADGSDTLDWIVKQPWSNGSVGMIGASYSGSVQWSAAVTKHPALKAIIPQVSPPDPTRNVPWDHGGFFLAPNLWWANIVKDKTASPAAPMLDILSLVNRFKTLPLTKVDDTIFGRSIPFYDAWLTRPTIDKWPGAFRQDQIGGVTIPTLHVSGTWDGDAIGTKLHWQAGRAAGHTNEWLVYGPWEHAFNTKTKIGDWDFGPTAVIDLDSLYLRFFDTYLKDMNVKMDRVPKARVFVTGANQWFTGTDWPFPYARKRTWSLAGGRANGAASEGRLISGSAPAAKDRYTYDPKKTTLRNSDAEMDSNAVTFFMGKGDQHDGMLLYRTDPFRVDTVLTGPCNVELYVSTTAKDATFHALLLDESTDGRRKIINQTGQMRVWFSLGKPQPIVPNQVYKVSIDPWEFAHRFKAGHRAVLMVTSDRFPVFARNPGTGEPDATATKLVRAVHTIHRGGATPSRVSLYAFEP